MFQVVIFWLMTPCNVDIRPQHYTGSHPRRWRQMDLRNVGILPQHYTTSQPGRPRHEKSI